MEVIGKWALCQTKGPNTYCLGGNKKSGCNSFLQQKVIEFMTWDRPTI